MKNRPLCICCKKPYGQRATETIEIRWADGEPEPDKYRGNMILLKEDQSPSPEHYAKSVRRVFPDGKRGRLITRTVWDGETFRTGGKEPFCTYACALAYAREAHKLLTKRAR